MINYKTFIFVAIIAAWLFQLYWCLRTFSEAKDDVKAGSKVSEWLYARLTFPIFIGLFFVIAAIVTGDIAGAVYCAKYGLVVSWPCLLAILVIRAYELTKLRR